MPLNQRLEKLKKARLVCPFAVDSAQYGLEGLLDFRLCWFAAENALKMQQGKTALVADECTYSNDFAQCPIYSTNSPDL